MKSSLCLLLCLFSVFDGVDGARVLRARFAKTLQPFKIAIPAPKLAIPAQLILTARDRNMSHLPPNVQSNVKRTIAMNPDLHVKWMGDADCVDYIAKHYDKELENIYKNEDHGSYRGDICRASVLAFEGGFYQDLDVQLDKPFTSLVDSDTTFMTSGSVSVSSARPHELLNAIMAASPDSAVVKEQVARIRQLYRSTTKKDRSDGHMGPQTLRDAFLNVTGSMCSSEEGFRPTFHRECGKEVVRLLEEQFNHCYDEKDCNDPDRFEAQKVFDGANYALVDANSDVVGWSRFAACRTWGCNAGGFINTKLGHE